MISLLEVAERAYKGPRMAEKKWNLKLFKKIQVLLKRHKLSYAGPDLYFSVDDDYVDAAFKASVDFLTELGVYCVTTNRVIKFEEDEVMTAVKSAPREVVVGQGRDTRVIRKRVMEDNRIVNVISGGHCPWPQELASMTQTAYATVPRGDIIEGFNLTNIDGYEVHGLPLSIYAARREIAIMREAVRKAGRPGMAVTLYPILTKAGPMLAPLDPDMGLRRTDGILLSILPDTKVEADYIGIAIALEGYGSYKVNGGCFSIFGGFCGGVDGAVVEAITKGIAAWLIYRDNLLYDGSVDGPLTMGPRWRPEMEGGLKGAPRPSPPIWPTYVVHRALSRNTNLIRFGGLPPLQGLVGVGGIGSEAEFISIARDTLADTVMGCNLPCITGTNPTPYHVEFRVQASDAAVKAKIKIGELHDLMVKIDNIVTDKLHGAPRVGYGDRRMLAYKDFEEYFKPMRENYIFKNQKPSKSLTDNAKKAVKVLAEFGLDLEAAAIGR